MAKLLVELNESAVQVSWLIIKIRFSTEEKLDEIGFILFRFFSFYSLFHCVMVENQGQMASPVCMACRVPLGHLAVMDVTERKETRAARERLDPRVQLVQKKM